MSDFFYYKGRVKAASNRCSFCGTSYRSGQDQCHNCGAPVPRYEQHAAAVVHNPARQCKIADLKPDAAFTFLVDEGTQLMRIADTGVIDMTGLDGEARFRVSRGPNFTMNFECIQGSYKCTGFSQTQHICTGDTLVVNLP